MGASKGIAASITTHPALLETAYASFTGLPRPLFDNLRLIRTHALSDPPSKPYFSPRTLTDLRRPLMYLQSAAPYIKSTDAQLARWGLTGAGFRAAEQDHYTRQMELFGRAGGPIYNVYIRRTNHVTFSDLGLIVRVPDAQLMNIRHAHRIINDYTIAFFERYLNGKSDPLVDGQMPSPYEEVTVAARNVAPQRLVQAR